MFDEKEVVLLRPLNEGETIPGKCVPVDWTTDYLPAEGGPDVFVPIFVRYGVLGLWMAIHIPDLLFKGGSLQAVRNNVGCHHRRSR